MKKLFALLLLLIALLMTFACTPDNRKPWTVTNIEIIPHYEDTAPKGCEYTIHLLGAPFNEEFSFLDDCDRFQIGDTVKIAKP